MVRFHVLAAAACAALLSPSALAAGGGGGHGGGEGPSNRMRASFTISSDLDHDAGADHDAEAGEAGPRAVVIPTLSMPAYIDGELITYFFVNVRVIVAEGSDPWSVREKTHYIRDAMIRAGHRRSIADPAAPERIDTEVARDILADALGELVDLRHIERIEFTNVDRAAS